MVDRNQSTAKDYLLCICKNLRALEPDDKRFGQKKDKALECCKLLWVLMGYGRHCWGGDLPTKG
jgi:hypothetical protein